MGTTANHRHQGSQRGQAGRIGSTGRGTASRSARGGS